ncbi:aldo/keto reductase [Candidatus Poribacteria bacterium]
MQTVELGRTGIRTSRLGFGTGTRGFRGESDQTRIGHDNLVNLMRFGYDQGIALWDTADGYGSHPHIADALEGLDRSSVVIVSKSHTKSPEKVRDEIPRFLSELRTDYIDILLMHCINDANWLTEHADVVGVFREAKEKGQARAIGMSCHDFGALKTVAAADWIDVVLARINYDGAKMDAGPDEVVPVLEDIHDAGKGVLAMKVIGQGQLSEDVPRGIRFAMGLSCVDTLVIGMDSESQIRQNVSLVNEYEKD